MSLRPILVVGDSDVTFDAIGQALRRLGRDVPLVRCTDGDSALAYLRGRRRAWPYLVLLDLNPSGSVGTELLRAIKSDPRLGVLPVLVMSPSGSELDMRRWYGAGANSYLLSIRNPESFTEQMRVLCNFWLDTASLPEPGGEV